MRGLNRTERWLYAASAAVVFCAVVALLALFASLNADNVRQDERIAAEQRERQEQEAVLNALDAKITEAQQAPPDRKDEVLGEAKALSDVGQAVVQPVRGERGESGEPGRPPTLAEVEMGVLNVLTQYPHLIPPPKEGPQGRPGIDGRTPTFEEMRALVAATVANMPQLRGQAGEAGRNGIDGKDGAPGAAGKDGAPGAPGKDAPPPTQEQVTLGVANVLAANPGLLPKGDTGPAPASFTFTFRRSTYSCAPTEPGSLDYACAETQ